MRSLKRMIMQIVLVCIVIMGCEMSMDSYAYTAGKKNQDIPVVTTEQSSIDDTSVEEREEKAILVEKYMRQLGYGEEQIRDVSIILNGGAAMQASVFTSSSAIWILLALAELIAISCMVVFIIKNTKLME